MYSIKYNYLDYAIVSASETESDWAVETKRYWNRMSQTGIDPSSVWRNATLTCL